MCLWQSLGPRLRVSLPPSLGRGIQTLTAWASIGADFWRRKLVAIGALRTKAALRIGAPLLPHVARVVCPSAEPEVRRVATRGIVTDVTNTQAVWNRPPRLCPRMTVGLHAMPSPLNNTMAVAMLPARPRPARVRSAALIDARPKGVISHELSIH